jgi:hypothetical protein
MHLARAFECHANAMMPATVQLGAQLQQCLGLSAPPRLPAAPPAAPGAIVPPPPAGAAAPVRPFHCLSPAEQLECRRRGFCYVRGHVCQQLFYLESADFLEDKVPAEVAAVAAAQEDAAAPEDAPAAAMALAASPTVSLYART